MKKTNAIRELEIHKIEHIIREYEVDEEHLDAVSVALKTNEDITKVFKTLVLLNEKKRNGSCLYSRNGKVRFKKTSKIIKS